MVIYAEYLFAENFITGLLILHLTGRICGFQPGWARLAAGGVLCGLYAFILFVEGLPVAVSIALKLAFSFGLVAFVFQPGRSRPLFRTALAFYLVSFAAGGVTIAFMYLRGAQGISANSTLYVEGVGYLNIASGFLAAYLGISLFIRWLKENQLTGRTHATVTVEILGKTATVPAMVDTGNFLSDPVTKKPIVIMELAAAKALLPFEAAEKITEAEKAETLYERLAETSMKNRLRLIPFQSVGQAQGMLLCLKPDQVFVCFGDGPVMKQEVILGIFPGSLGENWDRQKYRALLPPTITEGGIARHAQ